MAMKPLKNCYWGFLDELGEITVCKYKSGRQIELCEQMPFIRGIFEPFIAHDKIEAILKCKKKLQESQFHDKEIH